MESREPPRKIIKWIMFHYMTPRNFSAGKDIYLKLPKTCSRIKVMVKFMMLMIFLLNQDMGPCF